METALFLSKDDPSVIKNDKNNMDKLIKSKNAEVAPDVAVYCDKK